MNDDLTMICMVIEDKVTSAMHRTVTGRRFLISGTERFLKAIQIALCQQRPSRGRTLLNRHRPMQGMAPGDSEVYVKARRISVQTPDDAFRASYDPLCVLSLGGRRAAPRHRPTI